MMIAPMGNTFAQQRHSEYWSWRDYRLISSLIDIREVGFGFGVDVMDVNGSSVDHGATSH